MEKYALLTGASGGIGKAIAMEVASLGYSLYLHYNENKASIFDLVDTLTKQDTNAYPVKADLSTSQGVLKLVDQIDHPIHTIIHNSGKSFYGLLTDMDDDLVQRMVDLHITAPFLLTKKLLPNMISNKSGNIVVVSSIWGLVGASCEVLYSMVKGGQNTFVKALAKEVAPSGIRVNGVAPGAIRTNMLSGFSEEDLTGICEEIPLGRIGDPDEVAKAVRFLLTDESSYITGQILSVNGGWY